MKQNKETRGRGGQVVRIMQHGKCKNRTCIQMYTYTNSQIIRKGLKKVTNKRNFFELRPENSLPSQNLAGMHRHVHRKFWENTPCFPADKEMRMHTHTHTHTHSSCW